MPIDPITAFEEEVKENIRAIAQDQPLNALSREWMQRSSPVKFSYNFRWLGRPIIQYPGDIVAMQELIWEIKPDLIIETGIAHGGSLIFYASMLELLGGEGQVLGLDIDIREHNRKEIEAHPMYKRITMVEGNSISDEVAAQVYKFAKGKQRVMLVLDSCHSHDHVLSELNLYSKLVTKGSYLVVFDTLIDDCESDGTRPWGPGNSPKTAVRLFLQTNDRFEIDKDIETKIQLTVCPDGFLKCVKNS